jgi:ribonuclease BN (tRNA processing enzyme)
MVKIQKNKSKIHYTNNGQLELFFLGVGSAFSKKNFQTNLLLIKGDQHLLIDCGTRCSQAFYELGASITDVENFLITHSHADHIGGLEEVSLMGKYFTKRKPLMLITKEYQKLLWEKSLRGGQGYNEGKSGGLLKFEDLFQIQRPKQLKGVPREAYQTRMGDLDIQMFRTKHIPDLSRDWKHSFWSCGILIDEKILFTSDTRFDFELIDYYNKKYDLEVIFHDCQFFTGGVHASLDELNAFSPEIKKKMYLVHYGDNWGDFRKVVKDYGFAGLAEQHKYYKY